jgi:hypothetical protein
MGGHVVRNGDGINAYSVMLGKSERRRPLSRSGFSSEDNFKMGIKEI